MNTYYTLIAESGAISLQSHFYRVQVGTNRAARKAFFVLTGYCSSKNYYFRKRSVDDDTFRLRIAESLGCQVYDLPCMDAKVEQLISHLRTHGSLPWQPATANNLHYMKAKTSPSYYLLCNTKCLKRN